MSLNNAVVRLYYAGEALFKAYQGSRNRRYSDFIKALFKALLRLTKHTAGAGGSGGVI